MNKIISFFMAIYFSVMALFGIPFSPDDLVKGELYSGTPTQEDIALFEKIFKSETQWLASLQLDNGAIPMTYSANGELRMSPYFADFAALALLDNADKYAENVKKYMDWHFAHLNTAEDEYNGLDGTIYDYLITVQNGKVIDEKVSHPEGGDPYDSTDSYAATFLIVAYKYLQKTGDIAYITAHASELGRIASVMTATLHNGLTYAKPNHKVKYLMDNCEVYEGAVAAAELFKALDGVYGDMAEKCTDLALQVKDSINNKLWNFVGGYYTPERTLHGIPTKVFSWKIYYPQATSQLFPITSGIIEPETERAKHLYEKFSDSFAWESFGYDDAFYWGNNVLAAAIMNDVDGVREYMKSYEPLTEAHSWPLYNADSARVAMAANIMLERLLNE